MILENINYTLKNKSSFLVYITFNILLFICLIERIVAGRYEKLGLFLTCFIIFLLPSIIEKKFKIRFSNILKSCLYIFMFCSSILGEVYHFYTTFKCFDIIIHLFWGFIAVAISLSFILISKKGYMTTIYMIILAISFSMTTALFWEFGEFITDKFFYRDAQKDTLINSFASLSIDEVKNEKPRKIESINKTILLDKNNNELLTINGGYLDVGLNDSMEELMINFVGAITFGILGYFYIKSGYKGYLVKYFSVTRV